MPSLKGAFLVSDRSLLDPNFRCAVVLILEHGQGGAYGVVVNRPTDAGKYPLPVYTGGPCPSPGMVLLHAHREWMTEGEGEESIDDREIASGIFVGDATCLNRAAKSKPGQRLRFRVFQNYSGWGPGQLEQEIAAGAWTAVQANAELLFDVAPDELWTLLRPHRIPEPSEN
jgi:putative transcriptional regulator